MYQKVNTFALQTAKSQRKRSLETIDAQPATTRALAEQGARYKTTDADFIR
jgi:hypothetical protein